MNEDEFDILLDLAELDALANIDRRLKHLIREERRFHRKVDDFMVDTTQTLVDLNTAVALVLEKLANPPVPTDVTPDADVQTFADGVAAATAQLTAAVGG